MRRHGENRKIPAWDKEGADLRGEAKVWVEVGATEWEAAVGEKEEVDDLWMFRRCRRRGFFR